MKVKDCERQLTIWRTVCPNSRLKIVFLCVHICYELENNSQISSICYAWLPLNCKDQLCLQLQRKNNSKTIMVCICICYEMRNQSTSHFSLSETPFGRTTRGNEALSTRTDGPFNCRKPFQLHPFLLQFQFLGSRGS